ncbi:MAG: hypothetical protein V1774_04145 [Candidatus Eisenbacteria bacterium]
MLLRIIFSSIRFVASSGGAGRRPLIGFGCAALALVLLSGCATVGRDFPVGHVEDIRLNETTQEEIRAMFGEPWRVGWEDGRRTWTFGKYRYRLFGESSTQDLVLRFDDQGRVASYTFNTTDHDQ